MSLYDTDISALDGTPGVLKAQDGKVTLVVNVASKCGLTPQYTQLEEIQGRFADQGFTVLGVPCNQFGEQEPGTRGGDRHVLLVDLRRDLPDDREGRGER